VLDDPVRLVDLDDRRVRPDPSWAHGDAEAGAGADPLRLDPGQAEAGEEVVGEGRAKREVGDRLADARTGHVDLDLGTDRSHRRAILCAEGFDKPQVREIPDAAWKKQRYDLQPEAPGKETPITAAVSPGIDVERFETGAIPGSGTYFCTTCNAQLSLRERDRLPDCPRCEGSDFRRDSIFEPMQEHGQTAELAILDPTATPEWLADARAALPESGRYLAWRDDEEVNTVQIDSGWTRIGRSATADIRLDDPSVSRRHALIVSELPDSLRVLDDRSLNGVFLNGEIVEWARVQDGDELSIGRFRLFALEK
jgi:hypothetical protein